MSSSEKLLILSAGRGVGLDGFHKLNLVSPDTKETTLARYMRQFGDEVTVVVGYRAAELISTYPDLDYAYNYAWFETGSAFSAHIGLGTAPVTIVPSDLFITDAVAAEISAAEGNVIFMVNTENRAINAVNVCCDGPDIVDLYKGPKRSGNDAEFIGVVKIADQKVADEAARICEENPGDFFIECIAKMKGTFTAHLLSGGVTEINTIEDYLSMIGRRGSS